MHNHDIVAHHDTVVGMLMHHHDIVVGMLMLTTILLWGC